MHSNTSAVASSTIGYLSHVEFEFILLRPEGLDAALSERGSTLSKMKPLTLRDLKRKIFTDGMATVMDSSTITTKTCKACRSGVTKR